MYTSVLIKSFKWYLQDYSKSWLYYVNFKLLHISLWVEPWRHTDSLCVCLSICVCVYVCFISISLQRLKLSAKNSNASVTWQYLWALFCCCLLMAWFAQLDASWEKHCSHVKDSLLEFWQQSCTCCVNAVLPLRLSLLCFISKFLMRFIFGV